jgi:MFS family permease
VPPTVAIVAKLFGPRYLATLFGMTLLSHQIGGFFGAWLGGMAIERLGNYHWMWIADASLAGMAALVNLPIREAKLASPSIRDSNSFASQSTTCQTSHPFSKARFPASLARKSAPKC